MNNTRAAARPELELGQREAFIGADLAASILPRRSFGAHKWGVGGLVIVAGAPSFIGAAALCAQGAGRAGAGIVNLAVPRGIAGATAATVPEAAFVLLPETDSPNGGRRAAELIGDKLERSAALAIGPGLGQDEATDALLGALFGLGGSGRGIGFGLGFQSSTGERSRGQSQPGEPTPVTRFNKPLVIDADGLNWLAKQNQWWQALDSGSVVLTPHAGEMARLLDTKVDEIVSDPLACVREAAREWGQIVVLKHGFTAVSDGERTLVADDAPLSLASAGTGDVLTGIIGAFLAQGLRPLDAAALAIYTGVRAARRVEEQTGSLGLIASDLPPAIATELAFLERQGEADGR